MNEPQFQFRGIWLPADIINLLQKGKLTARETMLLAIIDGLCESGGKGCWASNNYLGKLIGVNTRNTQKAIAKLRAAKLIRMSMRKGFRTLETTWSRPLLPTSEKTPPHVGEDVGSSLLRKEQIKKRDNTSQRFLDESSAMIRFDGRTVKQVKANDNDHDNAEKLHIIVMEKQRRKNLGRWSKSRWAEAFRLLRTELEDGDARVQHVLEWYSKHHSDEGVPSLSTAEQFRKRFDWLEDLATRKKARKVLVSEVSDEAKAICKRIMMLGWPKCTKDEVLACIQQSLDGVKDIRVRRRAVVARLSKTSRTPYGLFVCHLQHDLVSIVENWMRSVHDQIKNWDEWRGNLSSFALSLENKQFQKLGRKWAQTYSADPSLWDRFVEDAKQCG